MALTEPTQVQHITPVDITGVQDAGVASVILLAVSLGWNYTKRVNGPALIIARDGMTKRLPTDTSVRMSVFQTALSTVMVHTEPEFEATIELIDKIVAKTKPSKDHERRLRLAVGETPQEHRDRIAAMEAEPKDSREPQPVTQRLEIPEEAWVSDEQLRSEIPVYEPPAVENVSATVPADDKPHGKLIDRHPFMARHQRSGNKSRQYVSDSSFERVWEDGYKDYECTVCGKAYTTPKGVGSHRQFHMQSGEIPRAKVAAYKRTGIIDYIIDDDVEFVDELPSEQATVDGGDRVPAGTWGQPPEDLEPKFEDTPAEFQSYADIVTQIAELILPMHTKRWQNQVAVLQAEIDRLNEALDKIQKDWNALKELLSGR